VTVSLPPDIVCLVTARQKRDLALAVGDRVNLVLYSSAVHIFP
jgi:hypothetical protein